MSAKFKVGQIVYVSGGSRFVYSGEATVTKVGRKYVTTDRTRDTRFDRETGREAGNVYGSATVLLTLEEWAESEERSRLVGELCEAGLDIRTGAKFTNERLARIIAAATTDA